MKNNIILLYFILIISIILSSCTTTSNINLDNSQIEKSVVKEKPIVPEGCYYNNSICNEEYECKDNKCIKIIKKEEAKDWCTSKRTFNMFILMDDNSYTVTDQEIRDYFVFASKLLYERTCTNFNIIHIGHISIQDPQQLDPTIFNYLSQHQDLVKSSNGLTVFTTSSECARTNGGCAWSIAPNAIGITDYCNTYSSYDGKTNNLYGNFVNWNHMYGRCGYDEQGNHISNVSLPNGECRNQPGTPCVMHNNYYMCQNVLDTYAASDRRIFGAGTIIHEIMHHYGWNADGNVDHIVESPACLAAYRHTLDKVSCHPKSDLNDCFFNICQYTYENFMNAENLCS